MEAKVYIKTKTIKEKDVLASIENILPSCYGLNSIAPLHLFDLDKKNPKPSDFIKVDVSSKGIKIDLGVTLNSDVKITEVLSEAQKRLAYEIGKIYGVKVLKVNIYAQNIK